MKTIILLLTFLISSELFGQVSFFASYDNGAFSSHSDNSLNLLDSKKVSRYSGFSAGVRFSFFTQEFQVEVGTFSSEANNLFYLYTPGDDGFFERENRPDLSFSSYPLELLYIPYKIDWFMVGVGPSMVVTNRKLQLNYGENNTFTDKINSVGLGFSIFAQLIFKPFKDLKNLDIFIGVKYRKINSFFMTKEGRRLGSYEINFSQQHVNIGFTWAILSEKVD